MNKRDQKRWSEAVKKSRTDNTMNKRYQKEMFRSRKSKNRQYNEQKITKEMTRSRK